MKFLKSHIRLTAFVLSFIITNTVLATESTTNESKDNGAGNTISNADIINNANSDADSPVEVPTKTAAAEQLADKPQTVNDAQSYRQQREERRRQVQQAQDEAYKQFLERRKQYFVNNNSAFYNNVPLHVQERRKEFIKQMEERRALNIKMMEQDRKTAEERRNAMQQKMHQTNTAADADDKA